MPNQNEVRRQITDRIIEALEQDQIPWRRPWTSMTNTGRPSNVVSRKPYQGVNPLILEVHAQRHGLHSKYWATFKQWQGLGGQVQKRPKHVKPGEWGCHIVFYRPVKKVWKDETGEVKSDRFLVMRNYTVFNADQVDGVDQFQATADSSIREWQSFEPADELIAATGARIEHHGDQAYYARPMPEDSFPRHTHGDYIVMPPRERFVSEAAYFESIFHECAHLGEVRTGWDHRIHGYAMGELVAEIASCYLATELGIPQADDLTNHASYIKSWLAAMKNDPKYIFTASTQASKVTDYLLSFVTQTFVPKTSEVSSTD